HFTNGACHKCAPLCSISNNHNLIYFFASHRHPNKQGIVIAGTDQKAAFDIPLVSESIESHVVGFPGSQPPEGENSLIISRRLKAPVLDAVHHLHGNTGQRLSPAVHYRPPDDSRLLSD